MHSIRSLRPDVFRRRTPGILPYLLAVIAMLSFGCASYTTRAGTSTDAARRDSRHADELNARASELLESDPKEAERILRDALDADLFCGPAHNNLGVVCFKQGRLFEAATEFSVARKLMPGVPDPRVNLSLCFEEAGRTDEAILMCKDALAVYPEHLAAAQQLVVLQIRHARTDRSTLENLRLVAMRAETERWRDWACEQELKLSAK